jgi:hypothetical protein
MRVLLIALVVAAGCSRGSKVECERRTEALATELGELAEGAGISAPVPDGVELVVSPAGRPVREVGFAVAIDADGSATLSGRPVGDSPDALGGRLRQRLEVDQQMAVDRPAQLLVLADRRLPVAKLAALMAAVPGEIGDRRLIVTAAEPRAEVPSRLATADSVKRLRADSAAGSASERAAILAERVERAVGGCAPLVRVFGDAAGEGASDKLAFIAREAPKAIRRCDCKVGDLALLEYALLSVAGAYDVPQRWLPLPAPPAGGGTVADLVNRLVESAP